MKSNYNDIIDIILTFIKDEEIAKNILVSGSIVPYLISSKVSLGYHNDLYFLVQEKSSQFSTFATQKPASPFALLCDTT